MNRPELMQKYVSTSVTALKYVLVPIKGFVKHLITIQGLDPDNSPRTRDLEDLRELLNTVHEEEYDSEYDVSWVQKKFSNVNSKYGDLTEETFVDITDISRFDDTSEPLTIDSAEVNQIAPECAKHEINIVGDEEQVRENYEDYLLVKPLTDDPETKFYSKDAIQQLVELANNLEKQKAKKTKKTKKSGIKTSKKKLNKKVSSFKGPATKVAPAESDDPKFKGSFRRIAR